VEDQQPAAGDLTDETPENHSGVDAAIDEAATDVENTDDATEDDATEDDATEHAEASDEAVLGVRERRPVGKWSAIAAAAAAVLFVGSAAFAGSTVQPFLTDRAAAAVKLRVARTAANAITTLWSYSPENIDKLADRASQYLSGDFEATYRRYIDTLVAPNKQAQITNTTQVTGAAVESLAGSEASAIVYTNTVSTSPATKDVPSLKYLSYRLAMERVQSRWLVTKMTTVTSLDLTPKF
jgi:Mce-associated membrane protein